MKDGESAQAIAATHGIVYFLGSEATCMSSISRSTRGYTPASPACYDEGASTAASKIAKIILSLSSFRPFVTIYNDQRPISSSRLAARASTTRFRFSSAPPQNASAPLRLPVPFFFALREILLTRAAYAHAPLVTLMLHRHEGIARSPCDLFAPPPDSRPIGEL